MRSAYSTIDEGVANQQATSPESMQRASLEIQQGSTSINRNGKCSLGLWGPRHVVLLIYSEHSNL